MTLNAIIKSNLWTVNLIVALLSALNAVAWGYAIKNVGEPQFSLAFLFKLMFNKYFILAILTAFIASVLSYVVLYELGVMVGRFFLSLQIVATIIACTVILKEVPALKEWIGILLIIIGILLIGRV